MARVPGGAEDLEQALYEVMLEVWLPYDDAVPTLRGLKARGIKTALVSNVGADIRPVIERAGLDGLLDAVVLSYEVGSVKPAAAIFERALAALEVKPANALMVGDNWTDDSGAARLGIRTLLLPRTTGASHGLEVVLRLVGA
jgi:HAD superfamily hydrolase (TIGR01509 family)